MNVNKKFGRFRQWAGEKMGGEIKTGTSEDFKSLEMEMQLRHEGMEKLQKSMKTYVKSFSTRNEGEDREKQLPAGYLGSAMVSHGSDFEPDSEFGSCLTSMGRTHERMARTQESFVADATTSWLEAVDRSMVQMKEYQACRKRLEARRLAYDTTLAKMQKAKKEDFRVEEELRAQKAKYEECNEEVYRRMQDIKEAEAENVADMTTFLEAELSYFDRCREVLIQLREEWPVSTGASIGGMRSRSNTAHSYADRLNPVEETIPEPKITIRSNQSSRGVSPYRSDTESLPPRSTPAKAATFDVVGRQWRDDSPASTNRLTRVPSEPPVLTNRPQLRPTPRDPHAEYDTGSPARSVRDRSISPATSHGSAASRSASWAINEANTIGSMKKGTPPPPPPSRAKKPPPPPPPMKRSTLSMSEVPHA